MFSFLFKNPIYSFLSFLPPSLLPSFPPSLPASLRPYLPASLLSSLPLTLPSSLPCSTYITLLPLKLGRLRNCWELMMHGVKPNNVPQHLLPGVRGASTKHLLAYLRAQLRHCVPYNHMKLMVVGLQVCVCACVCVCVCVCLV